MLPLFGASGVWRAKRAWFPDIEAFEERAAVAEHEGGLSRRQAETLAARDQGFRDADDYSAWLADYVVSGRAPR